MVLFIPGIDDEGHMTGQTRKHDVMQSVANCWMALCRRGIITKVNMNTSYCQLLDGFVWTRHDH